jgi:hypothetical protein
VTSKFLFVALAAIVAARAGEIELPARALERSAPVHAIYRTTQLATGSGTLTVRWTDSFGRTVEDRRLPFQLVDENEVGFDVDLRRAVSMKNTLDVHFNFEGKNQKGERDVRNEKATVSFIASPPDKNWWDYTVIMWQQHPAQHWGKLKEIGINGGEYSGRSRVPPAFLVDHNLRWYAENIATDFYAEYHRFRPDRRPNWSFYEALELYKKDPTNKEAFKRNPSLSDPIWLERVRERVIESAKFNAPYRPFFYSLGDESGIADLTQYWDFDFSDHALTQMRGWLKKRYSTLPNLNAQWGSTFSKWTLVTPETTNDAMKRADGNFSSWSDHKEFMDLSFANALKMGNDAIRSVDPDAYVSIGGAQMPGWGGYDYALLTKSLTAMEPYNIGNNVEIIRSLNPKMPIVSTAFARGPWEKHRVWYELLHGGRGLILWDEKSGEFIGPDGSLIDRGREMAPLFTELRNGIGALIINSERITDPIAIHYSQASMRINWMLEQQPKGEKWADRRASTERMDSQFMRLRESWCRMIEDLGLQYKFVAYDQVEAGELLRGGYRVFVLPRSYALSAKEAQAIREFMAQGGTVIADGQPGTYDEKSRSLPVPSIQLEALKDTLLDYHQARLAGSEAKTHTAMARVFGDLGLRGLVPPTVGIETHRFRNGGVELLALHSNPSLRVNELGPPDFKSNARFEKAQTVQITLPATRHVYEVRTGKYMGAQKQWTVTVDPHEPIIYAIAASKLPALRVAATADSVGIRMEGGTPASDHVFHLEVVDPSGAVMPHYSGNLLAPGGTAMKLLPFAQSDLKGTWQLRVHDLLSGQRQTVKVDRN